MVIGKFCGESLGCFFSLLLLGNFDSLAVDFTTFFFCMFFFWVVFDTITSTKYKKVSFARTVSFFIIKTQIIKRQGYKITEQCHLLLRYNLSFIGTVPITHAMPLSAVLTLRDHIWNSSGATSN